MCVCERVCFRGGQDHRPQSHSSTHVGNMRTRTHVGPGLIHVYAHCLYEHIGTTHTHTQIHIHADSQHTNTQNGISPPPHTHKAHTHAGTLTSEYLCTSATTHGNREPSWAVSFRTAEMAYPRVMGSDPVESAVSHTFVVISCKLAVVDKYPYSPSTQNSTYKYGKTSIKNVKLKPEWSFVCACGCITWKRVRINL